MTYKKVQQLKSCLMVVTDFRIKYKFVSNENSVYTLVIKVIHTKYVYIYDRYNNFAMFKQIRKWYTLKIICTYNVATGVCISTLKVL